MAQHILPYLALAAIGAGFVVLLVRAIVARADADRFGL